MAIELTKKDIFLDYILEKGEVDLRREDVREDLKKRNFWTADEQERMLNRACDSDLVRLFKTMPKNDEDGNVIERLHVVRAVGSGGGKKKIDLYVQRLNLTYEDKVYVLRYTQKMRDHFDTEFRRLYDAFQHESPKRVARKLERQFQMLLGLADPVDAQVGA